MQHRQPSLLGYDAGEDGRGPAHVAEVILCDMGGMALLSRSLPTVVMVVTMQRLTKPVQVSADSDRFGQKLLFANGRFDCKVSAKDTDGSLCIYDTIRTKQGGPPLHLHHKQDEWFFVRDGEFLFQIGEDNFRLKAGDSILGPAKVPHAFANVTEAGVLMIVFQPAGTMEQFFLDGSRLTNPSQEDLQALYRAHAMEICGPPLKVA